MNSKFHSTLNLLLELVVEDAVRHDEYLVGGESVGDKGLLAVVARHPDLVDVRRAEEGQPPLGQPVVLPRHLHDDQAAVGVGVVHGEATVEIGRKRVAELDLHGVLGVRVAIEELEQVMRDEYFDVLVRLARLGRHVDVALDHEQVEARAAHEREIHAAIDGGEAGVEQDAALDDEVHRALPAALVGAVVASQQRATHHERVEVVAVARALARRRLRQRTLLAHARVREDVVVVQNEPIFESYL